VEALEERWVPSNCTVPDLFIQFPNGIGPKGVGGPKDTTITVTPDMVPQTLNPDPNAIILLHQRIGEFLEGMNAPPGAGGFLLLNVTPSGMSTQPGTVEKVHVRVKLVPLHTDAGTIKVLELVLDKPVNLDHPPVFASLTGVTVCLKPEQLPHNGRHGPPHSRPHPPHHPRHPGQSIGGNFNGIGGLGLGGGIGGGAFG
jgi:hypothetical protein